MEEESGKRQAFADELTQPQLDFLFHAKEERKRMRREDSGATSGGTVTKNTTHIT